jgi:hypothetical protein
MLRRGFDAVVVTLARFEGASLAEP